MATTARGVFRNLTLAPVLSHHNLKRAWTKTVRPGLRNQELADLHDYLDVHRRIGKFHEELIDFLFFMLESFIWRPDYIPLSGVGLPQIQFDAPMTCPQKRYHLEC